MKRSIRALLLIISCVASSSAFAENPMKTVFGDMMSNSTSATTFNTAKRFGATGAGFQLVSRVLPRTSSRSCHPSSMWVAVVSTFHWLVLDYQQGPDGASDAWHC